ncbi:MAG: thioredoxin [Lachnospiraceae bacterium]|nr:thioredoxin [Lachnospiraceae bacterium]
MALVKLTTENFEQEVLAEQLPVLIDFNADWCGPCQMMKPLIDEISEEYAGKLKVCDCNVDENPALALKYGIMSIPCFILMDKGIFVDKIVGAVSKEELVSFVTNR